MQKNNVSYVFEGENGENSPNYLCRVRIAVRGFVNAVDTPMQILAEDVLIKVPGENPWYALFREDEPAKAETAQPAASEAGETAQPEAKPEQIPGSETSGDRTPEEIEAATKAAEEEEASKLKTLEQGESAQEQEQDPAQGNPTA